jgi:hypothetical protein
MRYRKKPVVIEAVRFDHYMLGLPASDVAGPGAIWSWITNSGGVCVLAQTDGPAYLIIHTLEGPMKADIGDWIIKGVAGEFYPCKPDIFAATYEPVEDGDQ